jgi:hypothetical protein
LYAGGLEPAGAFVFVLGFHACSVTRVDPNEDEDED